MRRQLASAKAALADSERECTAVRTQLNDEQAKVLRLEAQLAELQMSVSARAELDHEADVTAQRREQQQPGGRRGLWGFIAGPAPEYVPSPSPKK
jgi:multidrug resistance efflux pump